MIGIVPILKIFIFYSNDFLVTLTSKHLEQGCPAQNFLNE